MIVRLTHIVIQISLSFILVLCGTNLYSQSTYYVILVKGEVKTEAGKKLTKNDKFSDEVRLTFSSKNDLIVAINSKGGKYVLKSKAETRNAESDLSYFVKDVLLPVRSKASSRDFETDYLNFLRNNRFVFTDRLILPNVKGDMQLAYALRGKEPRPFKQNGKTLLTELEPKTRFLSVLRKENDAWTKFGRISLKHMDTSGLTEVLKALKASFKDEGDFDELVQGFLLENYGYLHPSEIERLMR